MNKVSKLPEPVEKQGKLSSGIDEDDISTPRDEVSLTENNIDPSDVFTSSALTSAAPKRSLLDVDADSKASVQKDALKEDCPTPPTPPLPQASRGVPKRLNSSIERVDLEYSLGSLDANPPSKRMCSSPTMKKKLRSSPTPPLKSAADALQPKFWRDAAAVNKYNIASSSFDVANEEGGSSPLSVEYDNGKQPGKASNDTESSDAALAQSRLSTGDSTPATPLMPNDKNESNKAEEENVKDKPIDDFDRQVEMRDTSGDKDLDSNISSASSIVDAFVVEEQEDSRPFPPAPPSTPAAPKDYYRPLPYQTGETSGELGYSSQFQQAQAPPLDDDAPTPPAGSVVTNFTPLPTFVDPEAPTPLPDPKPSQDDVATPAPPRDAATERRRGAATPAAGKRPPTLAKKTDFDKWDVGNRYELKRILGRGSYGEVAQAVDLHAAALQKMNPELSQSQQHYPHRNSTYVAVKKISKAFDQEVDAIRLFREMHILRRLRGHECVIQLIDVVQPRSSDLKHFNDLYLVFEYVDTDLYKLIMSPQYLTTEHIQTFLYQMLVGLKYIHSSSVIHRDLKPA